MAFLQANIYSNVLDMEVMLNVILPLQSDEGADENMSGIDEDISVLYLLHGMHGNHSVWARRTSIERYVTDLNMAVIMPSTDLGWYTDTTYDMKYWTFLSEELPAICQQMFPQLTTKREKTYAAGLSMGGYGAVKLGLRKPENFGAIVSLSGAFTIAERQEELVKDRSRSYWEGIFGPFDEFLGSENDVTHLIETCEADEVPRFYLACGTEDPLHSASVDVSQKMWEKGLDVTYEDGPGDHNWEYWDQGIQRGIEWIVTGK